MTWQRQWLPMLLQRLLLSGPSGCPGCCATHCTPTERSPDLPVTLAGPLQQQRLLQLRLLSLPLSWLWMPLLVPVQQERRSCCRWPAAERSPAWRGCGLPRLRSPLPAGLQVPCTRAQGGMLVCKVLQARDNLFVPDDACRMNAPGT